MTSLLRRATPVLVVAALAAALALTFATEALAGIRGMEEARFIVVAVAMILVLRLAPGGLEQLWRRFGVTIRQGLERSTQRWRSPARRDGFIERKVGRSRRRRTNGKTARIENK